MSDDRIIPISRSDDNISEILDRLNSGDGGGTYDGMEPRIAKLEARADGIEKRLDDIKTDIGRIETRLISMSDNQLTKWDMAQVVLALFIALSAAALVLPRLAAALAPAAS
jgi:hypothetical protein